MRASDLPFGEGERWRKGPRPSLWSIHSRLSTVSMEEEVEGDKRTSVCLEMVKSGGVMVQAQGGSLSP